MVYGAGRRRVVLRALWLVSGVVGATLSPAVAATFDIEDAPQTVFQMAPPTGVADTVAEALPESRNVDAAFLNPSYEPWVILSEAGSVFVTFLGEGAGYRNSLGYYTFDPDTFDAGSGAGSDPLSRLGNSGITDAGWLFPNVSAAGSGGDLVVGDTVSIGDGAVLAAGTGIGFFLAQNTWTGSDIDLGSGSGAAQVFFSHDALNPEAANDSTEDSARHVALMFSDTQRDSLILAFEDLHRTDRSMNDYRYASDEDFNDAVFMVRTNPPEAVGGSNVATALTVVPQPPAFPLMLSGILILGFVVLRPRDRGGR